MLVSWLKQELGRFKPSKKIIFLMAFCFLFILFLMVFRWDWLRPQLVDYVSKKSNREVTLGKLEVGGLLSLKPTITLTDVDIPNAAWSSLPSLVHAKKISFTFNAVQYLLNPKSREVTATIDNAQINLERLENGLRNWRLINPNNKGPGKYVLLSLKAEHSSIHFLNHHVGIDFKVEFKPNQKYKDTPNQLKFNGTYKDKPFEGLASTPQMVTFQRTKVTFPIKGYIKQGVNVITLSGNVGDVYKDQIIDADVHFTGETHLFDLWYKKNTLFNTNIIATTHLRMNDQRYQFSEVNGKFGQSDFFGDIYYLNNRKHPELSGRINSENLNIDDLIPMSRLIKKTNQSDRLNNLSTQDSESSFLKTAKVDFAMNANKINYKKMPTITNSNFQLSLKNALLKFEILKSHISDGDILGTLTLDTSNEPIKLQLKGDINNVPISSLLANTKFGNKLSAPLNIDLDLHANANRLITLADDLTGRVNITLGKGTISKKLDAKLGLDVGRVAWLSIIGDEKVTINCGRASFDLKQGIGKANYAWLDTTQSYVSIFGSFNLKKSSVDFTAVAYPKNPTLFTKDGAIKLTGSIQQPKITIISTKEDLPINTQEQECGA